MNKLTSEEQAEYKLLSSQSMEASNQMRAPLTPDENERLKKLYTIIKGDVNTEATTAVAQLTPEKQKDLYNVLLVKRNNALNYTGPSLTKQESNDFFQLNKILNKNTGGGRISKKRPTARRRRSSKSRKARKSRTTRRKY